MPFFSYNSDDTSSGQQPLAGTDEVTVGPILSGVASKVAGSVFSDVSGTFVVQQSFDYTHGGDLNPTPHWDVTKSFTLTGGTPVTIDIDVIAPAIQLVYTNGNSAQATLRIFVRVFGVNRG